MLQQLGLIRLCSRVAKPVAAKDVGGAAGGVAGSENAVMGGGGGSEACDSWKWPPPYLCKGAESCTNHLQDQGHCSCTGCTGNSSLTFRMKATAAAPAAPSTWTINSLFGWRGDGVDEEVREDSLSRSRVRGPRLRFGIDDKRCRGSGPDTPPTNK